MRGACPICGEQPAGALLTLPDVPVHANVLWHSREEAMAAPRADIELAFCSSCGMIWNVAFEPDAVEYGHEYENSLHFSPTFQRYAESLADRLIEHHDVRGKTVVEIGSGKGEFLTLICARGNNAGVGFDPSYDGESDSAANGRVRFVPELFTEDTATGPADLVVCRHVLEHLEDPVAALTAIGQAAPTEAILYFEVPSGEYLLREHALWDVIYPHYSIFTAASLRTAVERAGLAVLDSGFSFGGQYLWIEAARTEKRPAAGAAGSIDQLRPLTASFAAAVAEKLTYWARELDDGAASAFAIWGAGAKGTMFLNVVEGAAAIPLAVDVNPRKHDAYVPGTGQRIVGATDLRTAPPERVIVMNGIYRDEIAESLRDMGVNPRIDVA